MSIHVDVFPKEIVVKTSDNGGGPWFHRLHFAGEESEMNVYLTRDQVAQLRDCLESLEVDAAVSP